jgi:hypothetical protein
LTNNQNDDIIEENLRKFNMLNESEINNYTNSLSQYFVDKSNVTYNSNHDNLKCLVDSHDVLICISTNCSILNSLIDGHRQIWPSFQTAQMEQFPVFQIEKNRPWLFRLETKKNWVYNNKIESIEQLHEYILLTQKCACLDRMYNYINLFLKIESKQDNNLQQFIYTSKYIEAKEILEKNILEDQLMQFPYTSGYADVMSISLQEAAKMIKLQYEICSGVLAEYENLRIKFKNLIINESKIENLNLILNSFYTQFRKYSVI